MSSNPKPLGRSWPQSASAPANQPAAAAALRAADGASRAAAAAAAREEGEWRRVLAAQLKARVQARRRERQQHRLALVDVDRDLLPAGEQVLCRERVAVRQLRELLRELEREIAERREEAVASVKEPGNEGRSG